MEKKEAIQLTNGKYLVRDYGKYSSGLAFILGQNVDVRDLYKPSTPSEFNLSEGSLDIIPGKFWVSKKGTACFEPKDNGPHILVRDGWGGCFNKYRGHTLPEDQLYYHRASSNGGGSGYDYCIIPKEWRFEVSEEDI